MGRDDRQGLVFHSREEGKRMGRDLWEADLTEGPRETAPAPAGFGAREVLYSADLCYAAGFTAREVTGHIVRAKEMLQPSPRGQGAASPPGRKSRQVPVRKGAAVTPSQEPLEVLPEPSGSRAAARCEEISGLQCNSSFGGFTVRSRVARPRCL